MAEQAGTTHYFIIKHGTASVVNTSWTKGVWKNGTLDTTRTVVVQFQSYDTSVYVVSFEDDGTDQCAWDIEVNNGGTYYTAHFYVERDTVRKHLSALLQNINQGLSLELRSLRGVIDSLVKSIPQIVTEIKRLVDK